MTLFKKNGALPSQMRLFGDRAFVVGVAVLILTGLLAIFWPGMVARSYLFAYTFWLNTALGALGILMLLHASGGAWGRTARRITEAASCTLPALAILGLPLFLWAGYLYPWADPAVWMKDPILYHRRPFFASGMVFARTAVAFVIWIALAWSLRRASLAQDRADNQQALALSHRMRLISQGGLVLLFFTGAIVSVDWIMSREPHWISSIFGLILITGEALTGMLLVIMTLYCIQRERPIEQLTSPERVHDLGKLLLTALVMWAYMMFSQYLIQWLGNTQTDIPWFVHRTEHGWEWVGASLIFLHMLIPLFLLLSRKWKRNLGALAAISLFMWVMRWVDGLWLIAPSSFTGTVGRVYWTDLLTPIGIGGVWIGLFLRQLNAHPLFATAYATSGANRSALIVKGAGNVD